MRFANGVTLTIKPTPAPHVGQILMNVRRRQRPPRLAAQSVVAPAWALGGAFVQGGLRRYSIDDLQKRMSDK